MPGEKINLCSLEIDQETTQSLWEILYLHGLCEIQLNEDCTAFLLSKTARGDISKGYDDWFWGGHHHGGCSG